MNKFIPILKDIISEQKRVKLDPKLYKTLENLTNFLWSKKDKEVTKKTFVGEIPFNTYDGTQGLVKVYINPRLKYVGLMDTKPKFSRDPMDFVMDLQPKEYGSKKNLFLTLYHEMMHATDPTQSSKTNIKYQTGYSEFDDKKYWGHPIEFRAITNEFLEALVLEFKRRSARTKKPESKKLLIKSLDNIVNYFAKGEKLSKLSLDILNRMNDEKVLDTRLSNILADIYTDFPQTVELSKEGEEPYFLTYILKVKQFGPNMWSRFLTMLYKTKEEILQNNLG